jgi:hypothetical protein
MEHLQTSTIQNYTSLRVAFTWLVRIDDVMELEKPINFFSALLFNHLKRLFNSIGSLVLHGSGWHARSVS